MKILKILTLSALSVFFLGSSSTISNNPHTPLQGMPLPQTTVPDLDTDAIAYPPTRQGSQVDTYFGVTVPDPYRWLEDENAPETRRWIDAQNQTTFTYLDAIPFRPDLKARLRNLFNYARYSAPVRRGKDYFFFKNEGLQNQSIVYRQRGLDGEPEILLDPNQFSEDGTVSLSKFTLSKDGRYAVYGLSKGGSDWSEYHILDTTTQTTLPEVLNWIKISNVAWQGNGFYYSRYPEPVSGTELSSRNEFHRVYYHTLGTAQSDDLLIYEDLEHPERFHTVETTEDEQYLILSIRAPGIGKRGNALYFRDLRDPNRDFEPLIETISDDQYSVIDNLDDKFLLWTDRAAPNGKVVLYDPQKTDFEQASVILPERNEPLENVDLVGEKLFVTYLKDVTTQIDVYSLTGELENQLSLPGLGTVRRLSGRRDDSDVSYGFTSLTQPTTLYRYNIPTQTSSIFHSPEISFDAAAYETRQVFYPSRDGTLIPMFIVHRRGLILDGKNPTLLTAYGGFGNAIRPTFSASRVALLEQGVVYAIANIRGGGEYGRQWHEAAIGANRQRAFDDFIAAAEYLIDQRYTAPAQLAITGASNGGLLMGAVMNQRPDLFQVVVPQAGVMDMLRFHRFTIGWAWVKEYGSSDNETDFSTLYRYSPLHNLQPGSDYPSTLVTTADRDDRVVPAHSFKYAAALQSAQSGSQPVLIRIETRSGHGASSTTKRIELTTDIYAFILHNLGITPQF